MSSNDDRLLTVGDVARYLGVAKQSIYNRVSADSIPFVKVGRLVRFRRHEIDRWIGEQSAATDSRSAA